MEIKWTKEMLMFRLGNERNGSRLGAIVEVGWIDGILDLLMGSAADFASGSDRVGFADVPLGGVDGREGCLVVSERGQSVSPCIVSGVVVCDPSSEARAMLEFANKHCAPFTDGLGRRPREIWPFDGGSVNGSDSQSIGGGHLSEGSVMKTDSVIVA